jgi:hypothetical protein
MLEKRKHAFFLVNPRIICSVRAVNTLPGAAFKRASSKQVHYPTSLALCIQSVVIWSVGKDLRSVIKLVTMLTGVSDT